MPVRRVTVLGFMLAAVCAYALFMPVAAPALRLTVKGTQYALPGEMVLLRALLHDTEHDLPVAGVDVVVQEARTGAEVARGRTRAFGEARLELAASNEETSTYVVHSGAAAPARFQIVRRERHEVVVTSDRAVYQPGEQALFTVLVRRLPDLMPAVGTRVAVELNDPKKGRHGSTHAVTDAFGLAHLKIEVPKSADHGDWSLFAEVRGQKSRLPFRVAPRDTPELELAAQLVDGPAARWGDAVSIAVRALSSSGEPAAGGVATVTVLTPGDTTVVTREALLDDAGEVRVTVPLPASAPGATRDADGERRSLIVQVQVADTAGHRATARLGLRVQAGPLLLKAESMDPVWRAGEVNRVRVWAEAPDGAVRPARLTVRVYTESRAALALKPVSRHDGVEEFALPGQAGMQHLSVVAVDGEHALARRFSFANRPPKALVVRAARDHIQDGEPLTLTCAAPEATHLRVDVYACGRLIAMDDHPVIAGTSTLAVRLPPGPPGELRVQIYPIKLGAPVQELAVTRGTHAPLAVSVRPEKPAYRPGDAAALLVLVTGGSDPSTPAVVSLAVHDRATAGALEPEAAASGTPPSIAIPHLEIVGHQEPGVDPIVTVTRWLPRTDSFRNANEIAVFLLFWWLLLIAVPSRMFRKARLDIAHEAVDAEVLLVRLRLSLSLWVLGTLFFLMFIANQFKSIFTSMNVELPAVTKLLLAAGDLLSDFGFLVPVIYLVLDRMLVFTNRLACTGPRGKVALGFLQMAAFPTGMFALGVIGLAMFMPMLKLINNVDGGYGGGYSGDPAPDPKPLGVAGLSGVRRNFPTTLILEPSVRLGADRSVRVPLPATDAVTVYDAHVDAHDARGHLGSGTGAIRYTLPLYGRLRAPEMLRAGDRAVAKALIYSTTDTEADVVLTTSWGEQRARVKLTRGRGHAVTFALEPTRAGTAPLVLTVSAGESRDTSEVPLTVLGAAAVMTRTVRGAPPLRGPWTLAVPPDFSPGTAHLRLTLRTACGESSELAGPQPANGFTGDEPPQILAVRALQGPAAAQAFAGLRAQSRVVSARARAGDGTWYSALDLAAAYALDPAALAGATIDPFPGDGLVEGASIGEPDLRPTAFAATLAVEAGLTSPGLSAAHANLLDTAPGAVEGPYRAALTANYLLAAAPQHPLLPKLLDLLEARRRPTGPAWLPECQTLSQPSDGAVETVALAVSALVRADRHRHELGPVVRWLVDQRPAHAVARLAQARAVALARDTTGFANATLVVHGGGAAHPQEFSRWGTNVVFDAAMPASGLTLDYANLAGWVYEMEVTGEPASDVPAAATLRARFRWSEATVAPDGYVNGVVQVRNDSAYDAGPLAIEVPLPAGLVLSESVVRMDPGPAWVQRQHRALCTVESLAAGRTVKLVMRCRATQLGTLGAPAATVTDSTSGQQVAAPPLSGATLTVAPARISDDL